MSRISQSLTTALRTEQVVLQHQVRTALNQGALLAMAGVLAMIGLAMLNVAAFFWLWEVLSPAWAAFWVSLGNLALAGVLVLIAVTRRPEGHIEPVVELRDMALAELREDVDQVADDARELSRDLRRMARDPLGTALPSLIGPILSLLLSFRKK